MFLWLSGLVELHGGKVGVLSQEGQGSTFFFELPLFEVSSAIDEVAREESNVDGAITRTVTESELNNVSERSLGLEGDIETGNTVVLQSHQSTLEPSFLLHGWRWLLPRRHNAVYSSTTLPLPSSVQAPPVPSGPIPAVRTAAMMITASSGSPFAPNGIQVAVGSSAERRRKLLTNRYEGGMLTADFKIDENDSEGEDSRIEDKRVREMGSKNSSFRSSFSKRSLRFMVVDDTAATRKIMHRMLANAGHSVDDAVDG